MHIPQCEYELYHKYLTTSEGSFEYNPSLIFKYKTSCSNIIILHWKCVKSTKPYSLVRANVPMHEYKLNQSEVPHYIQMRTGVHTTLSSTKPHSSMNVHIQKCVIEEITKPYSLIRANVPMCQNKINHKYLTSWVREWAHASCYIMELQYFLRVLP